MLMALPARPYTGKCRPVRRRFWREEIEGKILGSGKVHVCPLLPATDPSIVEPFCHKIAPKMWRKRICQQCQNLDSKIAEWNEIGCNYCNGLMLHCRPDTLLEKLTIFYLAWSENRVLWKPEVFPAIFVALFSPSASSPFSHSPLRKPENPSEPENSPIRKAGSASSLINSHRPLKDALVTILCSEWIKFIMVGSHLYRAMSFHDTKHLA